MKLSHSWRETWRPYLFIIIPIVFGAALRLWPLAPLEGRIPWVTFYPIIMIAALLGGIKTAILPGFLRSPLRREKPISVSPWIDPGLVPRTSRLQPPP